MSIFQLVIVALMVVFNSLFAAYELALASVKPGRLKELADQRRRGARTALHMKDRMEASLAVVQLGITLVGAIAAATGGASVEEQLAPQIEASWGMSETMSEVVALTLFVIPLAAITIVFGELVPKVFALRNPELVCLLLSPAMRMFATVAFPAVWLFEQSTKLLIGVVDRLLPARRMEESVQSSLNELRAQVNVLRASRVIGPHQEKIILQASRLSMMPLRHIMVPVEDIVMLDLDAPLRECIIAAHMDLHTRFPVTRRTGDPQEIAGYVNFKELMFLAKTHPDKPQLSAILRPLISFPQNLPVSEALRRAVEAHLHLALVRDEQDQVVGMVTQEDIFEELVGDIEDEFDRLPRHMVPSGRDWIVGGAVTLDRLREVMQTPRIAAGQPDRRTFNDWIEAETGNTFDRGDEVNLPPLHVVIRKMRRGKVAEAVVSLRPEEMDAGNASGGHAPNPAERA